MTIKHDQYPDSQALILLRVILKMIDKSCFPEVIFQLSVFLGFYPKTGKKFKAQNR